MALGGSGFTTASNGVVPYFLSISVYPLALALLSLDVLFSEEFRNPGSTWKGRLKLLQVLRNAYNVVMVPIVFIMIISAAVGTLALFVEKAIWIIIEVITLRVLRITSVSRSTQELMELLYIVFPFPTKEIQLRVNISNSDLASTGYRQPYIERGDWFKFFLIQFEFPDPKLRDEAVSILVFNATACFYPVSYTVSERRVIILSPFGWVENMKIVRLLKLYTDEHSTLDIQRHSISSRWHDTRNNSVRVLRLKVERTERGGTNEAFVTWMTGQRCMLVLTVGLRDTILQLLPEVFMDLNLLPDMARSTLGQVYMSGLALYKVLLATAMTAAYVSYYEFETFSKLHGLDGASLLLALWALLYGWGFEPFLGPSITSIDNIVANKKMAALYSIAHDRGDLLFRRDTCSWAIKAMRGSHAPPKASKAELFLATHTMVMQQELYQVAMSDSLVSRGEVQRNGTVITAKWIDIFRTGGRNGIFADSKDMVS